MADVLGRSANAIIWGIAVLVVLGELTVGGVLEPRADWSDRAAHAIESSLGSALSKRGIDVTTLPTLTDPHEVDSLDQGDGSPVTSVDGAGADTSPVGPFDGSPGPADGSPG